tara:strand:- start:125 stop:988 length:864 start_codon:yes stop_codon:yes gene_type:complete
MNNLLTIVIFCIVLYIYIHIYFHIKKSNDLEVYEIVQPSKSKLEEICDLKQPIIFKYENLQLIETCNIDYINNLYYAFDINIRGKESDELYTKLPLGKAIKLFKKDQKNTYITENNMEFLTDTGMLKVFNHNDEFMRPLLVVNCLYDFMFGSGNTPLRYNINYRNYFYVTSGKIKIKLCSSKYTKYLYKSNDYENFEFRSPINPWNVEKKYKNDYDKIKFLEFTAEKGTIIHIPAYWWYSIQFEDDSFVSVFKYKTTFNVVAIAPQLVMSVLQSQNVKHKVLKKLDI